MGNNNITGREYQLAKIFSSDFDYYIPPYQRPYAWGEEEAGTLFDDLYEFYQNEKTDNYFLGSIVLIKTDLLPRSEVIDGQQRLTTLSILISVIASKLSTEDSATYQIYLRDSGNKFMGLKPKPRLHLREKEKGFFEKYIQNVHLDELMRLNPDTLNTEAQKHIRVNTEVLMNRVESAFGDDVDRLTEFAGFLVQRCYLVSVSTPSQESAFRVFSVMNSRGMDLLPIDIIKAEIIGKMANEKRSYYTDKWDNMENMTTRNGFNELFMHIRMIFAKNKARKGLLEEFREFVIPQFSPEDLIEKVLEPYTEAYQIITKCSYQASTDAGKINSYLRWLNKIDNSDWMPCAIKFFSNHKDEPEYLLSFVTKLERLAAYMYATSKDINRRIERYNKVLVEMEARPDNSLENPLNSMDLAAFEKKDFLAALDGEIYKMTSRRRNFIILRLDSFVSDGAASYDPAVLTIEHVLPQTVSGGSQWEKWWPNPEDRENWVHRIANLVPLTRSHNSEAQNYDFDKKKRTYFQSKSGTTSYALTTQVVNEAEWTKAFVEKRQQYLLGVFSNAWELQFTEDQLKDETENNKTKWETKDDLQRIRKEYWAYSLPIIQKENLHRGTFYSVSPSRDNWISSGFGLGGVFVSCVANTDQARVEFCLANKDRTINKDRFDILLSYRDEIEDSLGVKLEWDRYDVGQASYVYYRDTGLSVLNRNDWQEMAEFHAIWSDRISTALLPFIMPNYEIEERLGNIAMILRNWTEQADGVIEHLSHCARSLTRFTTPGMSDILPDIENAPSGWGTKNHYFYEIVNKPSQNVYIQLALNSKNMTEEQLDICRRMIKLNSHVYSGDDWEWRVQFKTKGFSVGDELSEDEIYKNLDACLREIQEFEKVAKKELGKV